MDTTRCPSLPPELWCHIASFLKPETLQHIRSVNRVLFDLALNGKYQDVRIEEVDGNLSHVLEALRNPDLARRVHSLYLDPTVEDKDSGKPQTCLKSGRTSVLRRIINSIKGSDNISWEFLEEEPERTLPSFRKLPSTQVFAGLVTAIVPLLVNLDSFELNLPCDLPSPYLDPLWGCHGNRLTKLRLNVTQSKMEAILRAPSLILPYLKLLNIKIDWDYDGNPSYLDNSVIRSLVLLAEFINALHNTLEDLSVTCRPMYDMSPLYENLGYFKSLKTINLDTSLYFGSTSQFSSALSTFVQRLSSTAENLTLSTSGPISPTNSYQFSFADMLLQSLRSLTMSAEIMALSWDDTLQFLTIHSPFLRSLTISGPIAPMEIQKILPIIGNNVSAVEIFAIDIYKIEPHVINILAQGLRRLQSLEIRFKHVYYAAGHVVTPSTAFPENSPPEKYTKPLTEMLLSTEGLSTWKLQDLTLKRKLPCGCGDIILWGLLRLFANCIPSITSFAGNGDMEETEPANQSSVLRGRICWRLKNGGHYTYGQREDV